MNFTKEILSIYPSDQYEKQKERYTQVMQQFISSFNTQPEFVYSAPGRSEICGNHTDHNLGKAVGASINLDIIAFVSKRDDDKIEIKANGFSDILVDLNNLDSVQSEQGDSASLVKGICYKYKQMGFKIGGFNAYTANNVLKGSGLSSSAAFEILIAFILNDIYNSRSIDAKTMAIASQFAENVYFGKASGLLDQLSCAYGGMIAIDFGNPENPDVRLLPFDFDKTGYSLIITDVNADHADLTGDYVAIKTEMQSVASFFGKEHLNEVDFNEFKSKLKAIHQNVSERALIRAFHFFRENINVEKMVECIDNNDFEGFKQIVLKSGRSSFMYLQNIYSDKRPTYQKVSLALCMSDDFLDQKGAWRVHGGGFGGTIQAYVPNNDVKDYIDYMESVFGSGCCYSLKIRNVGPVRVI